MRPCEIWELELWEYNICVSACGEKRKQAVADAIMVGYYAAYYTNGGRKAKNPQELIKKLYAKNQSKDEGLRDIERIKAAEQRRANNGNQ